MTRLLRGQTSGRGPAELTSALVGVLTDHGLRTRLGAAALARAGDLTWDRTALEVLRGVAGRPQR